MKMRTLGQLSLALAVCLSSAVVAQEEGRGRGRGGPPGGFGDRGDRGGPPRGLEDRGGMLGGGLGGGAIELLGLLRMEEVRKEVEMSPETWEAVQGAMPDMREMLRAESSERNATMKKANENAQDTLDEVLSPEHQKRLMGLLVQQNGNRAAVNELIAKEIGLDEAGVTKVREAAAKASEDARGKMREALTPGGGGGGFDREKMREVMESMQKDVDKAIASSLTAPQQKALEELKGAKFEFPENRGFGVGRGAPPGGSDRGGPPGGFGAGRGGPPGGGDRRGPPGGGDRGGRRTGGDRGAGGSSDNT